MFRGIRYWKLWPAAFQLSPPPPMVPVGVIGQGEEDWVIEEMKTGDEIRKQASYRGRSKAEFYSEKLNFDRMIEIFNEAMARSGQSHRGNS